MGITMTGVTSGSLKFQCILIATVSSRSCFKSRRHSEVGRLNSRAEVFSNGRHGIERGLRHFPRRTRSIAVQCHIHLSEHTRCLTTPTDTTRNDTSHDAPAPSPFSVTYICQNTHAD